MDLFATSQVNQIKLPTQFLLRLGVLLLYIDQKDTMTSRAVFIHI